MAGRQRQLYFILGGLSLLLLTGAAAYFYTQGTLFAAGCDWQPVEHPDTGETYSTVTAYKQALQDEAGLSDEELAAHLERIETRVQNGQVEVRLTDCAQGTGTGEVDA